MSRRPVQRPRATRRYRRRTLRVDVEYDDGRGPRKGVATTLGAGGLFVATEDPLDEATRLRLRFSLPGGSVHELDGRVVWANRPTDRHPHTRGMGIEFLEPGDCAALALELETLDTPGDRGGRRLH